MDQTILLSEDRLGSLARQLAKELECFPLVAYKLDNPAITAESVAAACGLPGKPNAIKGLEGWMSYYAIDPQKIAYEDHGFKLRHIQFEFECSHRKSEKQVWLCLEPRKNAFFWMQECKKCSLKVQELLLADACLTEISEGDAMTSDTTESDGDSLASS